MIELRKKKNLFHECIRKSQRQAFKSQVRKSLLSSQKRQKIINQLDQAFQFLNACKKGKENFWTDEFLPNRRNYRSIYDTIDSACQSSKLLMCEHEKDSDMIIEIKQYLFDNIPFLIPPPHVENFQIPNTFAELCLYVLKGTFFSTEEKQDFVERLNYETINQCLLNYFWDNWVEVSSNKCCDVMMIFFAEMVQFKNIFKRYVYNNLKFQFLLKFLIEEILDLTKVEREIYSKLQLHNQDFFDNFMSFTSNDGFFSQNLRTNSKQNEDNYLIILNKSLFLSNLLLLSPIPNYNIKETKQKLKAILNHLYRKFFLKQESQICQSQVEFCITVLLSKTIDFDFYNQFQIIDAVIKSGLKRQNQKTFNFQKEFFQTQSVINDDKQSYSQKENSYQQSLNISNQNFEFFLNKAKLLMLYEASEELEQLKFDHIEKWLIHQIRNEQNNIFSLQNPELMSQLLRLLTNILENHSKQKYSSYDSRRNHLKNRTQDGLLAKIKICKLIGKNGFDQLFQHANLIFYIHELFEFLVSLLEGLKQCGDISSSIEVLFFNSETLSQSFAKKSFQKSGHSDYEQMESESNLYMNSFKSHIYTLCLKFLEKSYKFMEYKKKQRMLLNLILVDFLTFQDCRKYLTREEEYRLKKNAFNQEDYYQTNEHMECESESERLEHSDEESQTNLKNLQFDEKFDEQRTWHTSEFRNSNGSLNNEIKFFFHDATIESEYRTIFSQPNGHFNNQWSYEKSDIEI